MPTWFWMIVLQVVLIALNAVFAGSEIAVLSVNELRLKKLADEGNKKAVRLQQLTKNPSRFLSVIQIAITLSGFLGSAFAADNFSSYLTDWIMSWGLKLPYNTVDTIAVIIITLILSYFTLVFGELVPKQIAIHKSESMALGVSGLLSAIARIFSPLVRLLTMSTNGVLKLLGINPEQETETVSEEEILMLLDAGTSNGTIDSEESELITNVFEFDDLEARDFLTHRTRMVLLDLDDLDSWDETIMKSERSMIPVIESDPDHVIGVLNTKKYFRQREGSQKERILSSMSAPYFVFETIKADDLFAQMKKDHETMAIVLDEYGGVSGLVTMNDLVEQLVGDLEEDEKEIEQIDDSTWRILGRASVLDVEKALKTDIDPDYVTFNGLIYHLLRGIPDNGTQQTIQFGPYEILLEDVDNHRVTSALVTRRPAEEKAELSESSDLITD